MLRIALLLIIIGISGGVNFNVSARNPGEPKAKETSEAVEVDNVEEFVEVEGPEQSAENYMLVGGEKRLIADRIASWNTAWKKVELNGTIAVGGLPVKPTVKVFMESGKQVLISIRAPFLGECARVEVTDKDIIIVNKIKRTYYKADPASIFEYDPSIISEFQALLLGRVALIGYGEFKADQADKVQIVQQSAEEFLVIPSDLPGTGALNFAYSVSPLGLLEEMVGVYGGFDGYANLSYARSGERLQIKGELVGGRSTQSATLRFDSPEWDGKGFSRLKIPSGYREVGFREVLRLN